MQKLPAIWGLCVLSLCACGSVDDSSSSAANLVSKTQQALAHSAHSYIQELANGDLRFEVTLPSAQQYVEVFSRRNDEQNIATNITGSEQLNPDGTATYSYVAPASEYASGDIVETRFYYYGSQPGQFFVPGPGPGVWSEPFVYGDEAVVPTACTATGSGENEDWKLEVLADGQVRASVVVAAASRQFSYVEAFVRRNGTQIIAQNIVSSEEILADGRRRYTWEGALNAAPDDLIEARFYMVEQNVSPDQVFVPGPTASEWAALQVDESCPDEPPTFVTDDATYRLGEHLDEEGRLVNFELFFPRSGSSRVTPLDPNTAWIVDRAQAFTQTRPLLLNDVANVELYVRECSTGAWINTENTPFAPIQDLLRAVRADEYDVGHFYNNIVTNVLLDSRFECPTDPPSFVTVTIDGEEQQIQGVGLVEFAYVVEHRE